jgi:hypothetical protein
MYSRGLLTVEVKLITAPGVLTTVADEEIKNY